MKVIDATYRPIEVAFGLSFLLTINEKTRKLFDNDCINLNITQQFVMFTLRSLFIGIRFFYDFDIFVIVKNQTDISFFYVSVLLLIITFVITLLKSAVDPLAVSLLNKPDINQT